MTAYPKIWYHGEAQFRPRFENQNWDRSGCNVSGNAEGPGIYFTPLISEAARYGSRILRARVAPSARLMKPNSRPTMAAALRLLKEATEEKQYYFVTNWSHEHLTATTIREAVSHYMGLDWHTLAVQWYGDLFGRDAEAYVTALVSQGWAGAIVPKMGGGLPHLVLWDPRVLRDAVEVSYDEDA